MKKSLLIIASALILGGCSARAVLVEKKVDYDPKTEARVRMYYVNGNPMVKTSNMDCETWENTSAKKPQRRTTNGLPRKTLRNISIGMPPTENSLAALQRDSITDTDSFEEIVVNAKQPVVADAALYNGHQGGISIGTRIPQYHCRIAGEFMLEAGKDYEISYQEQANNSCSLNIAELNPTNQTNSDSTIKAVRGKQVFYKACQYDYSDLNLFKKIFK